MASSRIFVKGLPPNFAEPEFKKHFTRNSGEATDFKLFPGRRIGYVGYKTHEEAQKAVKYFNKTFIRMSRIGVELARPVEESQSLKRTGRAPTSRNDAPSTLTHSSRDNMLKRKRDEGGQEEHDPQLKEYLDVMRPRNKRNAWEGETIISQAAPDTTQVNGHSVALADGNSDGEYEQVLQKPKQNPCEEGSKERQHDEAIKMTPAFENASENDVNEELQEPEPRSGHFTQSDADWARSKTSRLLGLLDEEEEDTAAEHVQEEMSEVSEKADAASPKEVATALEPPKAPTSISTSTPDEVDQSIGVDADVTAVRTSMRLFVRNLPYNVQSEDLRTTFAPYGDIDEIHIPIDSKSGTAKGFAYIQYIDPESAEQALIEQDGQTFQGRLLHILPGAAKREMKLDEFALSKLPLKKQQQIKKRREAGSTTFNWNALYMNTDAVVSSVANRLGLSKSEILDPTSSDAAIKQAHAETHIIQETKTYFKSQGVDLDSFKNSRRGDTAILVKNIPYDCSHDELKRLFEEHGDVKKFLMPPSGTIAIIEFSNVAQSKAAFGALAYRKVKSSVLFLEKAPKDLFTGKPLSTNHTAIQEGVSKASTSELKDSYRGTAETTGTATLFVRNLNFTTTTQLLTQTFKPLEGFLVARVKTRTDPKKPGQILSMGFGFAEFQTSQQAQKALQAMDGYLLEGHKLQIRVSHKGADAAEERRRADADKRAASQKTKIVIKNLPFEATKKDVRSLFGAYGQLRSVRVPKKMDRGARGFAFADFTTPKEAQSAMDALHDTHLLGRRLILDFAAEDAEDAEAEIEQMQQKVGAQVNKVALQKLTSGGRKKFTTQEDEDDE